jgi:hypothetical protein
VPSILISTHHNGHAAPIGAFSLQWDTWRRRHISHPFLLDDLFPQPMKSFLPGRALTRCLGLSLLPAVPPTQFATGVLSSQGAAILQAEPQVVCSQVQGNQLLCLPGLHLPFLGAPGGIPSNSRKRSVRTRMLTSRPLIEANGSKRLAKSGKLPPSPKELRENRRRSPLHPARNLPARVRWHCRNYP